MPLLSSQDELGEVLLYEPLALFLAFILTYCFIPSTYGAGAASGIFVPTLLAGAAGGRLVGRGIR